MARLGEPEFHHRNETVSAGKHTRFAVEPPEQRDGFTNG
jgi:hypothetical protein